MNSDNIVRFFNDISEDKIQYLIVMLSLILLVNCVDWFFGWINAKFNKKVVFESSVALYGIIKKMMYFIVLVIFALVAFMLLDMTVAIVSLTVLYTGYLVSELNSVLSHLGLTEDGKRGELFVNFMKDLVKGSERK